MNVEQPRIQCWDIDAGYAAAHERYRAEFTTANYRLQTEGFEEVSVLHSVFANLLFHRLKDASYLPAEEIHDKKRTFGKVFSPLYPLARKIRVRFQSEFAPAFCSMLKQGPMGEDIDDSYRWHRDSGPSSHLKLVIYLNDDHDGATAVMSRDDSRKFIDAGYLEQERLFHLDDFASAHGISYKPYKVQPKAGSGLIFEPTNVLHKGMYPTFGERRVFQMGIIPWGAPWESFYEEHWARGYTNSNGFPRYEAGNLA